MGRGCVEGIHLFAADSGWRLTLEACDIVAWSFDIFSLESYSKLVDFLLERENCTQRIEQCLQPGFLCFVGAW
jgi:hypothetical protein